MKGAVKLIYFFSIYIKFIHTDLTYCKQCLNETIGKFHSCILNRYECSLTIWLFTLNIKNIHNTLFNGLPAVTPSEQTKQSQKKDSIVITLYIIGNNT